MSATIGPLDLNDKSNAWEVPVKARIYTKTGDKGQTSLVGGTRVSKTDIRLAAYGTVDELNGAVGLIRSSLPVNLRAGFDNRLQNVQNNLFNLGSHLACEDSGMRAKLPGLSADALSLVETDMDTWEAELPPLKQFILPGGTMLAAFAHQARTICRRAEREILLLHESAPVEQDILVYVNRLSDWFFLLARKFNHVAGLEDVPWSKG
jgi:cob(I)alamin adenosyltransferase